MLCHNFRFELDMLLESVRSTAKRAIDLLNDINNNSVVEDGPVHIEDYFTCMVVFHLPCLALSVRILNLKLCVLILFYFFGLVCLSPLL